MLRIAQTFSQLSVQGRKGLIPFTTTGDPYPEMTVDLMHVLAKGGSNVIELGAPFSDPVIDDPVIQRTSERALAKKVGLRTVLEYVWVLRITNSTTPVVLMGYASLIERMGAEASAKAAFETGVNGVLVVGCPPEECEAFTKTMRAAGIGPILPLAPTSTEARVTQIACVVGSHIYYVSLKGVTGAATIDPDVVAARTPQVRQYARLLVGVGLGIRNVATARAISGVADAVVIGSRIVQLFEEAPREQVIQYLTDFVAEIRQVLDA